MAGQSCAHLWARSTKPRGSACRTLEAASTTPCYQHIWRTRKWRAIVGGGRAGRKTKKAGAHKPCRLMQRSTTHDETESAVPRLLKWCFIVGCWGSPIIYLLGRTTLTYMCIVCGRVRSQEHTPPHLLSHDIKREGYAFGICSHVTYVLPRHLVGERSNFEPSPRRGAVKI